MSGWTVVTLRARQSKDYEYSRYDNYDPAAAVEDICASVEADDRVSQWTMDSPEVYVYLRCDRYNWDFAEKFLEDYSEMVRDAVVLGANDTTDMGTARYYPTATSSCRHEYSEGEHGRVGTRACAVMYAQHGIRARDPFHEWIGRFDYEYANDGKNRVDSQ